MGAGRTRHHARGRAQGLTPFAFPTPAHGAPAWPLLLGELSAPWSWARGRRESAAIAAEFDGRGRPVLLIPGFLADEARMGLLASTLRRADYRAKRWGQGRNLGASASTLSDIAARIERIADATGQPVALVGWSLGGVFAREAAKLAGDRVDQVVTLGSPIGGDRRANHAWRLYERVAGHPVDEPPVPLDGERPPQPTTALWSRRDGVVAVDQARGDADASDRRVEVDCTHMGFVSDPAALTAVLRVLSH